MLSTNGIGMVAYVAFLEQATALLSELCSERPVTTKSNRLNRAT
jgi:hypothetical protein